MKRFLTAVVLWLAAAAAAFGQVPYFPQTLPAGTIVGRLPGSAGPTQAIPFSAILGSSRTKAAAVLNFYVRQDGNDTNTCQGDTAALACATHQGAINYIKKNIDFGNFQPVINVRPGVYPPFSSTHPWTGGSYPQINGEVDRAVSGASNNGAGFIRLTLSSTTNMVSGNKVMVRGVGGTTEANNTGTNPVWQIVVVDNTHIDLVGSTFTNAYTSGGAVVTTILAATANSQTLVDVEDGNTIGLANHGIYDGGFTGVIGVFSRQFAILDIGNMTYARLTTGTHIKIDQASAGETSAPYIIGGATVHAFLTNKAFLSYYPTRNIISGLTFSYFQLVYSNSFLSAATTVVYSGGGTGSNTTAQKYILYQGGRLETITDASWPGNTAGVEYNVNGPAAAVTSGALVKFSDTTGVNLAAVTTGITVANGGTGLATLTAHSLQVGNGTSPITQLAVGGTGTVLTGATGADPAFSAAPVLGSAGTIGTLTLSGNTSGTVLLTPQATAGTPTITFGTSTGTPAVTASAPLALTTATGNIAITGVAGQILQGATPAFTATPTLGVNAATTGQLLLANGGGSGASVTVQNNGATSAYNFNLPTTAGSAGQVLTSQAGGSTAMTWSTPAAGPDSAAAGGRCTLLTAVPVMTTTQSAKTTVYFTPYIHRYVPIYSGSAFAMTDTGGELSQATTDTTKSPAAVAASKNYDVFVWNDSGTIRATRGPTWNSGAVAGSDTARGTGAGSTDLTLINGIYVNANAITNGPAANRGTYVCTIRSNASSQIDWTLGAAASGGTAAVLGVWNMYNRVNVSTRVIDSGAQYGYTSNTIRQARASAGMQVSFLMGLNEDAATVTLQDAIETLAVNASFGSFGIGLDTTTAFTTPSFLGYATTAANYFVAGSIPYVYNGLGWHFVSSNEQGDGTNATIFNFGPSDVLNFTLRM